MNDFVDAFVIADHLHFGKVTKEVYMDELSLSASQNSDQSQI